VQGLGDLADAAPRRDGLHRHAGAGVLDAPERGAVDEVEAAADRDEVERDVERPARRVDEAREEGQLGGVEGEAPRGEHVERAPAAVDHHLLVGLAEQRGADGDGRGPAGDELLALRLVAGDQSGGLGGGGHGGIPSTVKRPEALRAPGG
jgi:hypothetical protein